MVGLELFSLAGRVAVVTGAASGLGEAIVRGLADVGALVACVDTAAERNEGVAASIGARAIALAADVTDARAIGAAMESVEAEAGPVDVLVNSAGIGGRSPAAGYPDDLWERVVATNLTGSFRASRAVAGSMIERGGGSIINIASIGGLVGFPGSAGYQASKGGVVQLTRTLAVEWAPHGVRVNAIAPGHIATAIVREQWQSEPELRDFFLSRTPLGRLGDPEDVVGAAIFLASTASAMVTGQVLVVDGGYTAQ